MRSEREIICENVRKYRKRRSYTQEDMAGVLHISLSSYRKLEQGQRNFTLEHLIDISNILKVELPCFLRMQPDGEDILNQSDMKRKEFLIELLKTFDIGTYPDRGYDLREISALLSFIRSYGHSVAYSPDKNRYKVLKRVNEWVIKGVADYEELSELYTRGQTEFFEELSQMKYERDKLYKEIQFLKEERAEARENSPVGQADAELNEYRRQIEREEYNLAKIRESIAEENKTLEKAKFDSKVLTAKIEGLKKEKSQISSNIKPLANSPSVDLESAYAELQKKYDALDDAYYELNEKYDDLEDNFCDKVDAEIKENKDEIISEYIDEAYHGIDAEDFETICSNMLYFAAGFVVLSNKYATANKDVYSYTNDIGRTDEMEVPYGLLNNLDAVQRYVKRFID